MDAKLYCCAYKENREKLPIRENSSCASALKVEIVFKTIDWKMQFNQPIYQFHPYRIDQIYTALTLWK